MSDIPLKLHISPLDFCIARRLTMGCTRLLPTIYTIYMDKNIIRQEHKPKKKPRIHIDVILTAEQETHIIGQAKACGMTKSGYLRELGMNHLPKQMMTESQEIAFKGLVGARAELVGIKNALNGLSSNQRHELFKDTRFMKRWIDGVNTLITYISKMMKDLKNDL